MKTLSNAQVGGFILDCMKSASESERCAKEIDSMLDKKCNCCGADFCVEDMYECDVCHKDICPECIIGRKIAEDDFMNICKDCLQEN